MQPPLSPTPERADDFARLLAREQHAHETFAATRRHAYVEREAACAYLDNYTATEHTSPLLITGEPGSGKSALLAWWTERYRHTSPRAFVIVHYIGASTVGNDHWSLLRHIMLEIRQRYALDDAPPTLPEKIVHDFPLWLGRVRGERLLLVVDGLDQLTRASTEHLDWLPDYVPPSVTVILSARTGPISETLCARDWEELEVPPLERAERRTVVQRYLSTLPGEVSGRAAGTLVDMPGGANPLFLRASLEDLRLRTGRSPSSGSSVAASTLDALYRHVLERLERERGYDLTVDLLSALWCSRYGLSDAELVRLTGSADAITILRDITFYLYRRNGLVTFFHDTFRTTVSDLYLSEAGARRNGHARLAEFFSSEPEITRRAAEEPWQWCEAGEAERLVSCLTAPPIFTALYTDTTKYELIGYWQQPGLREQVSHAYSHPPKSKAPIQQQVVYKRTVGEFLLDMGEYASARTTLDQVRAKVESAGMNEEKGATEAALGQLCYATRRYAEGVVAYQKALEATPSSSAERDYRKLGLGACLYGGGRLNEAEAVFTELIGSSESMPAYILLSALNNLGSVQTGLGELGAALHNIEQALKLSRQCHGEEHPETAAVLANIALLHSRRGELAEAAATGRRALEINIHALGPNHPNNAVYQINLGNTLRTMLNYREAVAVLNEALLLRSRTFGEDHSSTAEVGLRLARTYREMGSLEEAEKHYARYLPRVIGARGPDHPSVRQSQEGYEKVLKALQAPSDKQ